MAYHSEESSASDSSGRLKKQNGLSLHESIPMACWCVTRSDLLKLRASIKAAVRDQTVVPNQYDDFDPRDHTYGPSIYTVVDQFIKPITHMAGGQSWALMQHPQGLKCDLFVTHCWAEGVYEFIDKVLHSWPRGAKHAYCCMLGNPQALDIEGMLTDPSNSPFVYALHSSKHVLVVPNRKVSIYTRIWCTYEAYLAYRWNKRLSVASFRVLWFWPQLLFAIALWTLATPAGYVQKAIDAQLIQLLPGLGDRSILQFVLFLGLSRWSLLLVPFLGHGLSARFAIYLLIILNGMCFGTCLRNPSHPFHERRDDTAGLEDVSPLTSIIFAFGGDGIALLGHEIDRMFLHKASFERACLQRGFTGNVCNAESTFGQDKERILHEIRATEDEANVDQVIEALLFSGMSTDSIRKAARNGVEVEAASVFRIGMVLLGFKYWAHMSLVRFFKYFQGEPVPLVCDSTLREVDEVAAFAWLCLFMVLRSDSKAFAACSLIKFRFFVPLVFVTLCKLTFSDQTYRYYLAHVAPWGDICMTAMTVSCSVLGLGRVTDLPLIGRPLARYVVADLSLFYDILSSIFACCSRQKPRSGGSLRIGKQIEMSFLTSSSIHSLGGGAKSSEEIDMKVIGV